MMVRIAVNLGRRAWALALGGETLGALLLATFLVRAVPLRFTQHLFGAIRPVEPAGHPAAAPSTQARARAAGRRLGRMADRLPWTSTCLIRAVALGLLLKRRGITGWSIRFGVARTDGVLAAHAWMVMGSDILIGGGEAAHYAPLADLGGNPQAGVSRDD